MPNFSLALVGCGAIAAAHVEAAHALGVPVIGLCDVDRNRAEQFRSSHVPAAALAANIPELFRLCRPSAVIVCTPPSTHFELAHAALEAGSHVMCEKPLCLIPQDAANLVAFARSRRKVLLTSAKYRFVPALRRAWEFVASPEFGELKAAHIHFCAPQDMTGRWHLEKPLSGGGALMDNGPHAVDLARFLFGDLELAHAHFGLSRGRYPVEDGASLLLRAANGATIDVMLSWSLTLPDTPWLLARGTHGAVEYGWEGGRMWSRRREEQLAPYSKPVCFRAQLTHFRALTTGAPHGWVQPEDGAHTVRLLRCAYEVAGEV